MKLGILGGGNMGEALLKSFLATRLFQKEEVVVCEAFEEKRQQLTENYNVKTSADTSILSDCHMLILAIKPQDLERTLLKLKEKAMIVSLLAGIPSARLKTLFPDCRIVRTMPNLGVAVGYGMTGIFIRDKEQFNESEIKLIRQCFRASGRILEVSTESDLDKITAISGTGPAYFFYFLEQLTKAAQEMGFSKNDAELMVRQTLYGATEILERHPEDSAANWRQKVTSAKGTTEQAINVLDNSTFQNTLFQALKAAENRSIELGNESSR